MEFAGGEIERRMLYDERHSAPAWAIGNAPPPLRTLNQRRKSMIQATVKRGVSALALGLALAYSFSDLISPRRALASPYGQEAPAQAAEQTMEQKYKNIQVLKGLPASQMRPMMNYISASLGVNCAFCHVKTGDQWEFDKDD